ncbi:MAG: prolyl oligopeptidase family serine peptidase, partial [Dehalococcoidia bacterium]|nr:prolyl oligopeptidase family serine peptidase [Dehalococcoidia bacterium]
LVNDCRTAVDFLAAHPLVDADRIGVVGFSSGGCIAYYLAAQDTRIKATASVGTPARYRTMERAGGDPNFVIARFRSWGHIKDPDFPASPDEWGKEWDMVVARDAIAKISPRAVLIIHGNKDAIVAMEDARALYDAAGDPRELYQIGDAEHILRNDPRVEDMLRMWLCRQLGA